MSSSGLKSIFVPAFIDPSGSRVSPVLGCFPAVGWFLHSAIEWRKNGWYSFYQLMGNPVASPEHLPKLKLSPRKP